MTEKNVAQPAQRGLDNAGERATCGAIKRNGLVCGNRVADGSGCGFCGIHQPKAKAVPMADEITAPEGAQPGGRRRSKAPAAPRGGGGASNRIIKSLSNSSSPAVAVAGAMKPVTGISSGTLELAEDAQTVHQVDSELNQEIFEEIIQLLRSPLPPSVAA